MEEVSLSTESADLELPSQNVRNIERRCWQSWMIDEWISENANPALVLQIVLHKLTITTPVLVVESPGGPFEVLHGLSVDPAAGDMFPSLRFRRCRSYRVQQLLTFRKANLL